MADPDIQRVLHFWFAGEVLDTPRLDSRMERWFGSDPGFDERISAQFGDLVQRASDGELESWKATSEGRLALILLIDQFRRNIYRGTAEAFDKDPVALQLCTEGEQQGCHKELSGLQNLFFFMPLQHDESLATQKKAVRIYQELATEVSDTLRETFLTSAQFAELHHDIVAEFGRFPHRNRILGRPDSAAEAEYLSGDSQSFGQ